MREVNHAWELMEGEGAIGGLPRLAPIFATGTQNAYALLKCQGHWDRIGNRQTDRWFPPFA